MFKDKMKKLSLNKETIRALSGAEMEGVVGGRLANATHGCPWTRNCANLMVYKQNVGMFYAY